MADYMPWGQAGAPAQAPAPLRRAPAPASMGRAVEGYADNAVRRFMRWTGSIKPISLFYARTLHHLDRRVFEWSGGRTMLSAWVAGMPVVMLETIGARSGKRRSLPVLAFPDGEDLFVIASNYGQSRHPAWYYNLKAHPRARITLEGAARDVEAVEVREGTERERLFEQASRAVIVFPAYRRRTDQTGRQIPVVRLRSVAASTSAAPTTRSPAP